MDTKKNQDQDLFGTGYNEKLKSISNKYAPKVPLVNTLYGRFKNYENRFYWSASDSQHDFLEKLDELHDSLLDHFQGEMRRPLSLTLINHSFSKEFKNNITVKVGFIEQGMECLWDRFSMTVDDPVMCFCLFSEYHPNSVQYNIDAESDIISWKKPKSYRFHPERFISTRKHMKAIADFYKKEVNPNTGLMQRDQLNHLLGHISQGMNTAALGFPLTQRSNSNPSLIFDAEMALAMSCGRFMACGKQIFQFSKDLTEMLNQTGNDDIQMGNIKLPYNSLYLHFGPQDNLVLENGWLVDGAYIESRGDSGNFKITLTSVPLDIEETKYWFLKREPFYSQDIIGDYADKNLKEVISLIYKDSIDRLSSTKTLIDGNEPLDIDMEIVDVSEANAITRLDEATQKFPVYQSALKLIVNALCYITSYKEDIEYKFTDDVPKILLDTAKTPKQHKKLEEKLKGDGYSKVHICGENILMKSGISTGQRSVEMHWRRGHWRKQPYGENRSLMKLKWIMPMLIGAKDSESNAPLSGHIYEVE
ncbi:hypothetical protein HCY52_08040 [Acinetobacter radioresistens]|uniref:hypothetical protein n=1 Tax=Acinetobacter radioresistens TaxID=40216 RepID=UPI0020060FFB|nr:hypothetical protein [Acinetobacter radioresistens]MCK4083765.1 hypothetical protein [Acinetobacter radioresistens]